jgi:hypothetical protein
MTVVVHPPPHRIRTLNARVFLTVGAIALIIASATGAYRFLTSQTETILPRGLDIGSASRFPERTITYFPDGHFYLVHITGDRYRALYDHSVFAQVTHSFNKTTCRLRWYPGSGDYILDGAPVHLIPVLVNDRVPTSVDDQYGTGSFRDDCTGETFLWWGDGSPGRLQEFGVRNVDGDLIVYVSRPYPQQ